MREFAAFAGVRRTMPASDGSYWVEEILFRVRAGSEEEGL